MKHRTRVLTTPSRKDPGRNPSCGLCPPPGPPECWPVHWCHSQVRWSHRTADVWTRWSRNCSLSEACASGKQGVICSLCVCDGTFWERFPPPLKNKRNDVREAGWESVAGQTPLQDQSSTFLGSCSEAPLPEIHCAVSSPRITFSHWLRLSLGTKDRVTDDIWAGLQKGHQQCGTTEPQPC